MTAGETSCQCAECGVVCAGRFAGCVSVWRRGPRPVSTITFTAGRPAKSGSDLAGEGPLLEAATARQGPAGMPMTPMPMNVAAAPSEMAAEVAPVGPTAMDGDPVVAGGLDGDPLGHAPTPPAAPVAGGPNGNGHLNGRPRPYVGAGVPLVVSSRPVDDRLATAAVDEQVISELEGTDREPVRPVASAIAENDEEARVTAVEVAGRVERSFPEPNRPDVAVRFVIEKLADYGSEMERLASATSESLAQYRADQQTTAGELREMLAESTGALSRFGASMATISSELTAALADLTASAARSASLTHTVERMQDQLVDIVERLDDPDRPDHEAVRAAADELRLAVTESSKSLDRLSGAVGAISTDFTTVLGDTVEGAMATLDEVRELTRASVDVNDQVVNGLAEIRALREEISALRDDLAALAEEEVPPSTPAVALPTASLATADGLDEVLSEIQALRRRLPVGGTRRPVQISDDQVAYLVEAIAEATISSLNAAGKASVIEERAVEPERLMEDEVADSPVPRRRRRPLRAQDSSHPDDASSK